MVPENVDENSLNAVKVHAADLEHAPANLLEGVEVLRAFGKVKVTDARTLSGKERAENAIETSTSTTGKTADHRLAVNHPGRSPPHVRDG